jgi:AraC-like DNA-binding protein
MESLFFSPSEEVSSLVKGYEILRANVLPEFVSDKYVPNGYASLVFNFSGQISILSGQIISVPQFFLTFPVLKSFNIEASGMLDSFVVVCHASVFSKVFNINMNSAPESFFIELNPGEFKPLWDKLSAIKNPLDKINVFEKYVLENILIKPYQPDEIDRIYSKIMELACNVRINDIINSSSLSETTFRRDFAKRVGINAKSLIRIVRVNLLWSKIIKSKGIDFQEVLFDCNYYDQSHFIKDFKMLIGERPRHFFSRNLDHVRLSSGKDYA